MPKRPQPFEACGAAAFPNLSFVSNPMQVIEQARPSVLSPLSQPVPLPVRPEVHHHSDLVDTEPALSIRVLKTPDERLAITELRRHAPAGVEDDLGLRLSPLESVRDEIAVVTAIFRGKQALGTLRFVPSGHNLTGGERLMERADKLLPLREPGSWEVGRLIVAPGERGIQTLTTCLTMALGALTQLHEVKQFYAIATPAMARLWRRFGLREVMNMEGASGNPFVLVLGQAASVERILDSGMY